MPPTQPERLDIFTQFLTPTDIAPRRHKAIETTDILLQMMANGRGVTALPRWLLQELAPQLELMPVLSRAGGPRRFKPQHVLRCGALPGPANRAGPFRPWPRRRATVPKDSHSRVLPPGF